MAGKRMLKGWENVTCKLYVNSMVFITPL